MNYLVVEIQHFLVVKHRLPLEIKGFMAVF